MAIPTPITLGNEPKPIEKIYNFNHGKPLDLTPEAVAQVKSFIASNPEGTSGKFFRVAVEGGGCSGMQYKFTFDDMQENDHKIACEDIFVLLSKDHEVKLKTNKCK